MAECLEDGSGVPFRQFGPERLALEKNDPAVVPGLVPHRHLGFESLPGIEFHRPDGELSRSAVERAIARLKKSQNLIVCLFPLVPDRDTREFVVDRHEFHRLDFGRSEGRRTGLEFVGLQAAGVFGHSEGVGFGQGDPPGDPLEAVRVVFHRNRENRTAREENRQDAGCQEPEGLKMQRGALPRHRVIPPNR